jgi:pimeloyl-ACP methyl ester carboxylesterase
VNWATLGPLLAVHRRVYALDLPGFGLSYPNGRSASVSANADALAAFIDQVAGAAPLLIGNSMGGLLSIMYAAAHETEAVVLIDPVLPRVNGQPFDREVVRAFATYAIPGLGARLLARNRARTAPADVVTQIFTVVSKDRTTIAPDLFATSVVMVETRATVPGIDKAYLQAARSILRVAAKSRAYYAKMAAITAPVLLIHGTHDRLVPAVAARAAAQRFPDWAYVELPDAGHVPHMEAATDVYQITMDWLSERGAR